MNNKLYIGNLPYSMNDDELKDVFSKVGVVVSARIITDSMSGRSRGFGFVEMESGEMAQKAIEELNGFEVQGRSLRVAEARPSRGGGRGKEGGQGGGRRPRNFNRGENQW